MLWFDVEMIRYTTNASSLKHGIRLWFDVEMIRYTTPPLTDKRVE